VKTIQKNLLPHLFLSLLGVLMWAPGTSASQRSVSVGIGPHTLLSEALGEQTLAGFSLPVTYEFELKPTFSLGIHLGYRMASSLHQMSYGLLLKHYLDEDAEARIRPFLEYGLLLLVTRVSGREGSGTSHDTQLSVGSDFTPWGPEGSKLFAELSYHYSRLSYFESDRDMLDSLQVVVGPKWRF
jgi:hypothetical protein